MRRKPVAIALFAMLLGGVAAGTATVVAQQSTGDAGQHRAASAPQTRTTETTTSSPTTTSKPKPKAKRKPSTSKKPKPTRQTSSKPPKPTTTKPKPTQKPQPPAQPQPSTPQSAVNAVVNLVNQERSKAGCGPVRVDERLNRAASKHSADMQARGYFSHDSPDGRNFVDRVKAEGYPSPGAENIGKGYRTAEAVMEGWMTSDGHRDNILNCDLKTVGVGLAKQDWLWTQVFGF